jgi:hypothetical protein
MEFNEALGKLVKLNWIWGGPIAVTKIMGINSRKRQIADTFAVACLAYINRLFLSRIKEMMMMMIVLFSIQLAIWIK